MVASPAVPLPVPSTPVPVTLVLGGARSGKSRLAEGLLAHASQRTYLATAEAGDAEMAARIADHRTRRGTGWITLEEPLELVPALARATAGGGAVLVDCLTLWLGNLLGAGREVGAEGDRLVAALPRLAGPVVLVSNEVGLGIVPDNALARAFRDEAGRLHQAIAAIAQRVYWVAAGLPLILKDQPA
jgi:adenosylcobinamide kinase/adenosylcobinamide-phosphate guanylyltransferase